MPFAEAVLSIFCQAALMKIGSLHRMRNMKSNLHSLNDFEARGNGPLNFVTCSLCHASTKRNPTRQN